MPQEFVEDNSILIVPNALKNIILKSLSQEKKLINIKFLSREEFIEKNTFSFNTKTILYLMDKYNYNFGVTSVLLDNMKYVESDNYFIAKLNDLYHLKKELCEEKLLISDGHFKNYGMNHKIYVYGYLYIDNLFQKCLDQYNYEIININDKKIDNHIVYEASTLEEEVDFVFNRIGDLLNSGISINNVKIVNYSNRYDNVLHKLSKFYKIPVEESGYSIYSTEICQEFLSNLIKTKDFSFSLGLIKDKYENDELSSKIIGCILNIANNYNDMNYSFDNIYSLVKKDLKTCQVTIDNYANKVSIGTLNPYFYTDEDYVFLIGFNQNELPKLYKDEDYINDYEKSYLNIEDTNIKNKLAKEQLLFFIHNIKNLTISYPLKHLSDEYHPSNLISENNFEIKKITLSNNNYSKEYAAIKLTKYLDDFIKYGTINSSLSKYYSNYKIDYLTYNNQFKGIDKVRLEKRLNNNLSLSYSSINTYNKCHFRYYIENILKLNKYEETFSQFVGNLFHYMLSICFNDDFDFDQEWNKYLNEASLSIKDHVLLIKLKEELIFIIDFVKRLHQETALTNYLMEQKIALKKSYPLEKEVSITFKGFIDKCMYREKNGETLISIIDYKTGNTDIDLNNVKYGIGMQLPIYWYLVKKGNIFNNPKFVGFYLEKILHGELKRDPKKSYQEIKLNNLKLIGYSTCDKKRLANFDPTYEKSDFISSMAVKNDGEFYSYTKTLSDEVIDLLVDYIDKVIEEDISDIIDGDFSINPKQIDKDLVGCAFCNYRDLCYVRNENIVKLPKVNDLSFLGGDDNA